MSPASTTLWQRIRYFRRLPLGTVRSCPTYRWQVWENLSIVDGTMYGSSILHPSFLKALRHIFTGQSILSPK